VLEGPRMEPGGTERTCLHCALVRALRAETPALERRGIAIVVGRSDAVWLPVPGTRVYRGIRRLLRDATAAVRDRRVRLAVVDLAGKPHVEVMATVLDPVRARVFRTGFARVVDGRLPGGFTETA
jgi:hypothetical protein